MNIKQIVDKIVKEADLNPDEYTVDDRIADINTKYLYLVEWGMQIGSTETITNEEDREEIFTLVDGLNTISRTIQDVPLYSIEYTPEIAPSATTNWIPLDKQTFSSWFGCEINVYFDEKRIIIEKGRIGSLRVRYARGYVDLFQVSDYSESVPPSPLWLPEVYHPLLWLEPATIQAEYYKKDRAVSLRNQLTRLEQLFYNHYGRNATQVSAVKTHRGNYR